MLRKKVLIWIFRSAFCSRCALFEVLQRGQAEAAQATGMQEIWTLFEQHLRLNDCYEVMKSEDVIVTIVFDVLPYRFRIFFGWLGWQGWSCVSGPWRGPWCQNHRHDQGVVAPRILRGTWHHVTSSCWSFLGSTKKNTKSLPLSILQSI